MYVLYDRINNQQVNIGFNMAYFDFNKLTKLGEEYGIYKSNDSDASGRRVRLRPKPDAIPEILGNSPLLKPLKNTTGMVWPYQPEIQYAQDVQYTEVPMVHTNQEFYAYTRTPAVKLTCSGEFTVQNQTEGLYTLACLHFLRTITKMYFGASNNAGTPPPILLFDAYGQYMFNRLPVIVTNFQANMPKDIDYVPVDVGGLSSNIPMSSDNMSVSSDGKYVWLPALFTISVSMTVQNTPKKLREFNLDSFRNGGQLKSGGWI